MNLIDALESRRLLSGDFNFDGNEDLVLHDTTTGVVRVAFLNDDDHETGRKNIGVVGSPWRIAAIGNFDNDLFDDADILWRNTNTGQLVAWRMNGTTLAGFQAFPFANPAVWEFAAAGEHDDPGGPDDMDLLWRNRTTGQLVLWLMDFNDIDRFVQLGSDSLQWQVAGMSEVRGDGPVDVEILFRNTQSGANRILRIDNNVRIGFVNLPPAGLAWRVAGYNDADEDNPGDIFWHNPSTGLVLQWELDDGFVVADRNFITTVPVGQLAHIGG